MERLDEHDGYVTTARAAELLHNSIGRVIVLVHKGKLRAKTWGGDNLMIEIEAINERIASRTNGRPRKDNLAEDE